MTRQTAHIEGEVEIGVEASEFNVAWTDTEVKVEYADGVSVVPISDDGYLSTADAYVSGAHTEEIIDLACGAYETHMNHKPE